jgi:hypothetical protein
MKFDVIQNDFKSTFNPPNIGQDLCRELTSIIKKAGKECAISRIDTLCLDLAIKHGYRFTKNETTQPPELIFTDKRLKA